MNHRRKTPNPLDKSSLSVILAMLHPNPASFRRYDRGVAIKAAADVQGGLGDKGKPAARQGRKATTPWGSVWLPKI